MARERDALYVGAVERIYRYVGPASVREAVAAEPEGTAIRNTADLEIWATAQDDWDDGRLTATFVVMQDRTLRVAPQRSEHVACAGGEDVLAAGELVVRVSPNVGIVAVTNQSTGYCPEPDCWRVVRAVVVEARIPAPQVLTSSFVFRRCPACGERNLVKEAWFECALCGSPLPERWNFGNAQVE